MKQDTNASGSVVDHHWEGQQIHHEPVQDQAEVKLEVAN